MLHVGANSPFLGERVKLLSPNLSGDEPRGCAQTPPVMLHNLRTLRTRKGWRLEDAAQAFGMSAKGYEKLEYSERRLSLERIHQAAGIYEVSIAEVVSAANEVSIVGSVGPRGVVSYHLDPLKSAVAPRPVDATSDTVALSVDKGVTLPGIAQEDYLIYHNKRHIGVPEDFHGKLCVVSIDGEGTYIRRVYPGGRPETYDLVGSGLETIRDASVAWSALVTWLKPV